MNSLCFPALHTRASLRLAGLLVVALLLPACGGISALPFRLTHVTGHLPDLKFQLTNDRGKTVTAQSYRGKVTMLYFGYTYCPDVCPLTMTRMHVVMQRLGKQADDARFLFVTVDPLRDTVPVLHRYVTAFDTHAVGLTGKHDRISALAKRYRAAFDHGKKRKSGGYDVNHSSAIYIFDRHGRARVLATPATSNDDLVHDLHLLLNTGD